MKQMYDFKYGTLQELQEKATELGANLPLNDNTSILNTPFKIGETIIKNRMGVAPMEGVDSEPDGTPGELTFRRYRRFAEGGAGLIWFESVSIVQEGRSSPKQLLLTKNTLPAYQRLTEQIKEDGMKKNGFAPYLVMQANHSGRYSRPDSPLKPEPMIAFRNPYLEKASPLDDSRIVSDDYLKHLEEAFGEGAELAKKAGFDAVDIKCCHGYLLAELAGAFTRSGNYGGSFDNRFRLFFNAIKNAQQVQSETFQVLARVGVYDNIPYPYGFGMSSDGNLTMDLSEPLKLMEILHSMLGVPFVNITVGDPHYDAYVTRPFNNEIKFEAKEDPLLGVARIFGVASEIKNAFPALKVSASAPSYLRQFAPNLAAGAISKGFCDHVCFGRLSFANPSFANDICHNGNLTSKQSCLACSKCSELIRAGEWTGCVIHDKDVYLPIYQHLREKQLKNTI